MRARFIIGLALVALGAVWIGQGVGLVGGSFMTGHAVWAVIGAIVVFFGVTVLRGVRKGSRDREDV